jgi:hypothetical protein
MVGSVNSGVGALRGSTRVRRLYSVLTAPQPLREILATASCQWPTTIAHLESWPEDIQEAARRISSRYSNGKPVHEMLGRMTDSEMLNFVCEMRSFVALFQSS